MKERTKSGTTPGGREYKATRTKTKSGKTVAKLTFVDSPKRNYEKYSDKDGSVKSRYFTTIGKHDQRIAKGPTKPLKKK
jgi:hypothetical protein